jgi:hypothetical protein
MDLLAEEAEAAGADTDDGAGLRKGGGGSQP